MAINGLDAIWIATAALAAKKTKRKRASFTLEDVCFSAEAILELAKKITTDEIGLSTVLCDATAEIDESEVNYLVDVNGLRRVSYMGEFTGVNECPSIDIINEGREITAVTNLVDVTEMYEFMNRGYTTEGRKGFNGKKKRSTITEWIIPGNPNYYDVLNAFRDLKKVDWRQNSNVRVGDIVYIYLSKPEQAIRLKCKVNKVDLKETEIDDQKYYLSNELNEECNRYMELELIDELEGDLYGIDIMTMHGLNAPIGPVRNNPKGKEYLDLVQKLQKSKELEPDEHDGSYRLVSSVIDAYANMDDLSNIDYRDLNLVYLMTVGTWKQQITSKKKSVNDSNLPDESKEHICKLLDELWAIAEKGEYGNEGEGRASIVMFGTGFFSFLGKTDDKSPRNFIQMCIDIKDMTDEDEILARCEQTLNGGFRGMKAASASMVLHCLKPTVFPIFNSNMGANNIFVYLGVKVKRKTEIDSYIKNVRLVKNMRDANFSIKNYRIFDMAARGIGAVKEDDDSDVEYWPSIDDYDPGISKEKWIELLNNPVVTKDNNLKMLTWMLELGGESTCYHLAEVYGGTYGSYNAWGASFGERVHSETGCPLYIDDDRTRYYKVPFVGRNVEENGNKRYSWKLRDELKEALEDMSLSKGNNKFVDSSAAEFDKNMILYGPPGTGKTYMTALYAVAIIETADLDSITAEPYEDVIARYNKYKSNNQIEFVTFHQSYGYEDFIEGIKPVMNDENEESKDVEYEIVPGVFNLFCEKASQPILKREQDNIEINTSPTIWKISLEGTGDNPTREECLEKEHVRIGYDSYGENITGETDFAEHGGKNVLNAFIYKMKIGDIVLSCYSATTIDAIGIVTGDYEWHDEYEKYKRLRKVNWIVKNIREDITVANGSTMTLSSVYRMSISLNDVMAIIGKYSNSTDKIQSNRSNYVFVIDEINRGNISKVFGELITLIEPSKRIGHTEEITVRLPYSKKSFGVPDNVYLIGTMNTADRSIATIDTALRRRFQFVEMMPESKILRDIGADIINEAGIELDVAAMLDTINARIELLFDREHTIGHAFFTGLKDEPTVDKLASIFKKSIIPLLQEYFYEDYSKIMLVLGDNGKSDPNHRFIVEEKIKVSEVFRGNSSDIDIPDYVYKIQDEAFGDIMSYIEISE